MTTRRCVVLALALVLAGAPRAWPYHPFGRYNTAATPNTYVTAHYDVSKLPNSTVTFYLSDQRPLAMASGDSIEALLNEVAAATAVWNSVSTSTLRVNFGGYTKVLNDRPASPLGTVRFSSSIPPGAAAVGGPVYTVPSGVPEFLPILSSRVLLPADLSQTSSSGSSFLPILVHEMGHSLGAKHSVVASVMFQTLIATRAQLLSPDDVALISTLHPTSGFTSSTGAISGRVTSSTGEGVSVAAVSAFSDTAVIGAFTNPDGGYTIRGLPPGSYRLMVQPLMLGAVPSAAADNPGDPADLIDSRTLANAPVPINTNVAAAFVGAGGTATREPGSAASFVVSAGQTTSNANVSVGERASSRLEVNTTFSFPPAAERSVQQIWVTRGGQVSAGARGRELDTGVNIGFTNTQVAFVPGTLRTLSAGSGIFTTGVGYTAQAGAAAVLGSSSVIYTKGTDLYFSPGQVNVVASGPPRITSISPTAGPANTQVTISGSSFADAARVFFDGMPATVISRSGTSLVVRAPQGVGGRSASVFVTNPDGQGSEFLGTPPTFAYDAAPQASIALSPAAGSAGRTLSVTVTGANTNFVQGLTTLGFGSGDVVVNSITVSSPTSLVAGVTVRSQIDSRSFPVTAVTGQQVAYLPDGFTIAATPPFALRPASGYAQTGPPGSTLSNPLVVRAEDAAGGPMSGISVTFTVTFGGGTVSPATAVTDAGGLASTRLTLGASSGVNVVQATADQFAATGFIAGAGDANSVASFFIRRGGNNQSGPAGSDLPTPLSFTLIDAASNPLPGIPVTWQVATGNGAIRPSAPVTDSRGQVTAIWTLGPAAGEQTVTTSPFGFGPLIFTATAVGGGVTPVVPSNGILNGAGFDSSVRALSPGVIASIFGTNLSNAPASGVLPGLAPGTDLLNTVSNGTRVTFDGVAAPLFFVSPGQLNVQVPFEVAGRSSTQVVVSLAGMPSASVTVSVLPVSPGLFTVSSSGKGPATALNQDGSTNSAANAAARGDVIQLFATGLGALNPPVTTGRLAPSVPPLALSVETPTVTIGGIPAAVEFSGLAPGLMALWQVNARVPNEVGTGEQQLVVRTGGQNANPVTVFVR